MSDEAPTKAVANSAPAERPLALFLRTEMTTAEIPLTYRGLVDLVGERCWRHRVTQMKAAIRGNRLLSDYLHEENYVAFALSQCGDLLARYGDLGEPEQARSLYPAISFAAQLLSMAERSEPEQRDRLAARFVGAIENPDGMRSLRLEMAIATHFARSRHELDWPEMSGTGTFDLLVKDLAESGLELECKSISEDKGRRIHRREVLDFLGLLLKETKSFRKSLNRGLFVVLTVPECLPTAHSTRLQLSKQVQQQALIGQSGVLGDGSTIRVGEFDASRLSRASHEERQTIVRGYVDTITGTDNREAMVLGTDRGGALAFVVQSMRDDDFMNSTFRTFSEAAKKQLTGTRAGILLAAFTGLKGEELTSIAGQDDDPNLPATALARRASDFLSADYRDHVAGLAFLSRSALHPLTASTIDSGGTAYYFPRKESIYWRDDLNRLFAAPS